jgi:dTDP-4-amino-4,6-dideoxygalactose transaminase
MVGTNGKMTEISAAMGLTGLESLDEFTSVNRRNYLRYQQGLAGLPGITMADYAQDERSNFQYIVLEVDESRAGITRDRLVDVLQAENVMARRYFHPGCHLGEPYRSKDPNAGMRLPVTERLAKRVMALPNGTAVGPDQVSDICGLIGFVLENPASIASAA